MKKVILILILFLSCYFIYNFTKDDRVSYLTLGDSLSKGTTEYGVVNKGYSNYIKEYLKENRKLKDYNKTFTSNDYRILDIIKILSYNEKKDNYSLNRLIKESDIITISLGMTEIYNVLQDITPPVNFGAVLYIGFLGISVFVLCYGIARLILTLVARIDAKALVSR